MTKEKLSANQLRSLFLSYFHDHGHTIVASSSLVPNNDPTLLFTNAGMVQFKDVFLGKDQRPYQRAASSQRCVRAGGKHNDLERVGYTARHHTFFEMLGNFSFGNYFKKEAIHFAWQFLTDVLHLPPEKLWVTVYKEDQEAADIWLKDLKIASDRFSYCGEESNFWSMGTTGPCGPCTEIFYDHGAHIAGGPPGTPDEDGDRYVEIWNLVFMQYNRAADGTLAPLPKPSVDTGMGLERISAVLQGVTNNYDTDLFQPIIQAAANIAHTKDYTNTSLRVIADHIRSSAFLILDGITPSNEGRGYVLRRIIRRALRHGHKLGITEPFFYRLVKPLAEQMQVAYPELHKAHARIEKTLHQEEEQFSVTLSQGLKLFEQAITDIKTNVIPGNTVFKLYDTYGFPVDLIADIARERTLEIDYHGFDVAMNEQRQRSRQANQFEADYVTGSNIETPTEFVGYKNLLVEHTPDSGNIIALYYDGEAVDSLIAGQKGSIILDRTPFYAESGGQVGDQGTLSFKNNIFAVLDTKKQGKAHVHIGEVSQGKLQIGDTVTAKVNAERRAATVLNHTATHLLHMVLREVLGEHTVQKGSLVEPDRLRFDFSHSAPVTTAELKHIEKRVNEEIRANHEASVRITSPAEAIQSGAMALFEEKYGDEVRVVRFGNSVELCGGTHAHYTGSIGLFKITSESGVAAGIRRIEAVTGEGALQWFNKQQTEVYQKYQQAEDKSRQLEKQLEQLKGKLVTAMTQELLIKAKKIGNLSVLTATLDDIDSKALRNMTDQLKHKLGHAVVTLATIRDGKVSVVSGVTKDYLGRIKAGDLVKMIASHIGGNGGGRPDLAEAGGNQPENLAAVLETVYAWVESQLGK